MTVTVIVPRLRADELNPDALKLPPGTPYMLAEYDEPSEYRDAVNEAVIRAETEFVFLSASDAWLDSQALEFLEGLAWDSDVTYGKVVQQDEEGNQTALRGGDLFCPHRLKIENYLPELLLVRRTKFLEVGGLQTGAWALQKALLKAGAKFKAVPEALCARKHAYDDPSLIEDEHLASFYYQSTPATAYWRCLLPARHLPGIASFNFPAKPASVRGTVVFQFAGDRGHLSLTQELQERFGIRVLIESDDNYLNWMPLVKRAGWKELIDEKAETYSVEGHRKNVELADGVIVTTEFLARQYRKLNEHVYVCPNQIDPDDWPPLVKPDDGVFRIGWFASRSHAQDGRLIARALDWASTQKDVEIVMMGAIGQTNGRPWWKFPYKHVAWSNDMGVYRRFLAELDVGLAPIVPTPWASCRSDLKALEYGMVGAVPVLSEVPPYESWVDSELCFKASDAKGFLRVVQHLVGHRDEARQIGQELREHILAKRTMQANIDDWRQACQT